MNFLRSRINTLVSKSIEAQTQKWLDTRNKIISATDFGTILGVDKYRTVKQLLNNKVNGSRYSDSIFTLHGRKFEPVAISVLEKMLNIQVEEVGLVISDKVNFIGATPDGITIENGKLKLIEIKCPLTRQIDGIVPFNYFLQMQMQMFVCDVDECIFFECDFKDVSKTDFENNKTSFAKGKTEDSYWLLERYNMVRVKRDKDFFNQNIHKLYEFHNELTKLHNRKNTNNKKRRFLDDEETVEEPPRKKQRTNNQVVKKYYEYPISNGNIKNFTINNKCDTWLKKYGNKYFKNQRNKNKFSELINQVNTKTKKHFLDEVEKECIKKNISYIKVPKNTYYSKYLEELTRKYMNSGYQVIINPCLYNEKNNIFSTPTMIVFGSVLNKLFYKNQPPVNLTKDETNSYLLVNKIFKNIKYINHGTKLSNDFKHKHFIAKNSFDNYILNDYSSIQLTKSYIIGEKWQFKKDKKTFRGECFNKIVNLTHNLANDEKNILKYIQWVRDIYSNDNKNIFKMDRTYLPCYSKNENTDWTDFKKSLLKQHSDISLLYGIGNVTQKMLHENNIYSWKDPAFMKVLNNKSLLTKYRIKSKDADIMKKIIQFNINDKIQEKILPANIKNIDNWLYPSKLEFFVDFEVINSFVADIDMIYLIGMYCKMPDNTFEYYSFFSETKTLNGELKIVKDWINTMNNLRRKYNVNYQPNIYCWSNAENNFMDAFHKRHNINTNIKFVDLMKIIKTEQILIKGNIYGFSIKDYVKYMFSHGLINHEYKSDCNAGDLSIVSIIKYYNNNDLKERKELVKYNQIDCLVMYDILNCFRNKYNN